MTARLVVFFSGSGGKFQAVLDAAAAGDLPAHVVGAVSNRRAAYGLVRREAGVETLYFPWGEYRKQGRTREEYDAELARRVLAWQPDLLVFAGWMHILSPVFLQHFPGSMMNVHPALPGQFPGAHCIEQAFHEFQQGRLTHSGCMVHHVVAEVDAGPVIVDAQVPFELGDTLESFEQRMHAAERRLIVEGLRKILGSK